MACVYLVLARFKGPLIASYKIKIKITIANIPVNNDILYYIYSYIWI